MFERRGEKKNSQAGDYSSIVCTACGGHLGHVFKGEKFDTPSKPLPVQPTPVCTADSVSADERHCVNSVSLKFKDDAGVEK